MNLAIQPIIQDFQIFLDYIVKKNGIQLTNSKQVLRSKDLSVLNERMSCFQTQFTNNKSQQTVYALLNTFFYIAKVSELTRVQKEKSKFLLFVDEEKVAQFQSLNEQSQYFFLFESFWAYIDWDTAYEIRSFWRTDFYQQILEKPVNKWVTIGDRDLKRKGELKPPFHKPIVEMLTALGFLQLEWDDKLEKRPDKYTCPYDKAAISQLGKTFIPILFEKRVRYLWDTLDPYYDPNDETQDAPVHTDFWDFFGETKESDTTEEEESPTDGPYVEPFAAVFIDDVSKITSWYPIQKNYAKGRYTFKVALAKDLYRVIAMDATETMEDLHLAIQSIYDFGNDHLYEFRMDGLRNYKNAYGDVRGGLDYARPATAAELGNVRLFEGKQFYYIFDFGDNWQFLITVLSIDENAAPLKRFKLIESVGEAPEQYPSWEDEE